MESKLNSAQFWVSVICTLCIATFAIRLTGPSHLEGYAQMLNVGYVMDMMWRGHWLAQHDIENAFMSKPPLHTWLIGPFAAIFGVNRLTLALPSFLSILGLGLLILHVGRQRFGIIAGGFAALAMVMATPMLAKQIALVRTDPLFSLTIAAAAFAAFYAWEKGRSWTPFWVFAALATLTKGPLGILLAAGGLIAVWWEKRANADTPQLRGSHLAGIAIFLIITLGWFLPAWLTYGSELTDKQFGQELVGQAVGAHKPPYSLRNAITPTLFLLMRFLPFSPFVFLALWRVFRHPAADPTERRFERFLTCWLLLGIVLFSVIRHQRPDHLLPLWPAGALLAGREIARLLARFRARTQTTIAAFTCALLLLVTAANTYKHIDKITRYSAKIQRAAIALAQTDIDPNQLEHFDTPVTFQMYLKTCRPWKTREELERIIAASNAPVYIALGPSNIESLGIIERYPKTELVFRWSADEAKKPAIKIYRVTR